MQATKKVLFDNIGHKTKTMAFIIFILGFIASSLYGIYIMYEGEEFLLGLLIWVIGTLVFWATSIFIYGFGELIDNTSQIVENTTQKKEHT